MTEAKQKPFPKSPRGMKKAATTRPMSRRILMAQNLQGKKEGSHNYATGVQFARTEATLDAIKLLTKTMQQVR
jgi:hypothetical protein